MQLLESPIPPLTAAALWMTICKSPAPPDDNLQETVPLQMTICKRPVPLGHHLQEADPPDNHVIMLTLLTWLSLLACIKC